MYTPPPAIFTRFTTLPKTANFRSEILANQFVVAVYYVPYINMIQLSSALPEMFRGPPSVAAPLDAPWSYPRGSLRSSSSHCFAVYKSETDGVTRVSVLLASASSRF